MRRGLRGSPLRSVLSTQGALGGGRGSGGEPTRGSPCLPVKFNLCSRPSSSGRSLFGREGTAGRAAPLRDCCHRSDSLEGARGSFSPGQERSGRFFQPFPSPGITGLANTAVFGKQNPSTSQCCLGFDSSEGKARAGLLFCLLFSKFLEEKKKKKALAVFHPHTTARRGGGMGKQHGLLHIKTPTGSCPGKKNEWR